MDEARSGILPGLPVDLMRSQLAAGRGNEIGSGKFLSPESSSALAANAFGPFLKKPAALPPLPIGGDEEWTPFSVTLESESRFPWSGGTHPWLDVMVELPAAMVGIESKRFEPFRSKRRAPAFSDAYWRPVWGKNMGRYCQMRNDLSSRSLRFERLDAAQLVKHAFGLRTTVHRARRQEVRVPVLLYLYAEPVSWPDGRPVSWEHVSMHREEVDRFAERVAGDEVRFVAVRYRELLDAWKQSGDVAVREHAIAIETAFSPCSS